MLTRRTVLSGLIGTGAAVAGGIVAIPALLTSLFPAFQRRQGNMWRAVGRLSEFPVGEVRLAVAASPRNQWPRPVANEAVFVWRSGDEEIVVFSRKCTDLACPLNYDSGSACYFCPCHGGIFAEDGTVMAGPPPRPMRRYVTRVRDGVLEIDLASLSPVP